MSSPQKGGAGGGGLGGGVGSHVGARVLGVVGLLGAGLVGLAFTYRSALRRQADEKKRGQEGRGPSSASASAAAAAAGAVPLSAIIDPKLRHYLSQLRKVESAESDIEFDEIDSDESVGPASSTKLARVLRDIRRVHDKRGRHKNITLPVLHRIAMARLLLAVHRSTSAKAVIGQNIAASETQQREAEVRREDYHRGLLLLEGREAEADAMELQLGALSPADRAAAFESLGREHVPSDPFPLASLRQQLLFVMLEFSFELQDRTRMHQCLTRLLQLPENDSPSARPAVISPATLAGLDRDSCFVALNTAATLGAWLWTFQLSQHLFARNPHIATEFHERAVSEPAAIDFCVVAEFAVQKLLKRMQRDPGLASRLGIEGRLPVSTLPFDEDGRLIASIASLSPPPALSASAPAPAALSSSVSSLSSDSSGSAAAQLASLSWEEWTIRAYSSSVTSVDCPDANLKAQLSQILGAQKDALIELSPLPSSPDSQLLAAPLPPKLIFREGALWHSVGLFSQAVPIVGSSLDPPPSVSPSSTCFFMQGFIDVDAGSEGSYKQHEHYYFERAPPLSASSSMLSPLGSSLIEAHASAAGSPQQLTVDASSTLPSAFPSPVAEASRAFPHAITELDSPPPSPTHSHLFDSASFASMHIEHFNSDSSRLASPPTPPPTPPVATRLQMYAASLPGSEVWTGVYKCLQLRSGCPVAVSYRMQLCVQNNQPASPAASAQL